MAGPLPPQETRFDLARVVRVDREGYILHACRLYPWEDNPKATASNCVREAGGCEWLRSAEVWSLPRGLRAPVLEGASTGTAPVRATG